MSRTIYTDGGCCTRTKIGAWAAVREDSPVEFFERSGIAKDTTCNRMEMSAIIAALEIAEPDDMICSDSQLCVNTLNDWAAGWERNGWRKKDKQPVKNLDLVQKAFALKKSKPTVRVEWVRGHSGILGNEKADQICTQLIIEGGGSSPQGPR